MGPQRRIDRLLGLRAGELPVVALLAAFSFFCTAGGFVLARAASRTLFLSRLEPRYVPYKLLVVSIGTAVAATIYARVARSTSRFRLVVGSQLLFTAGIIGLRLLLATPAGHDLPVLCGLYVWLEVVATIVNLQLWLIVGDTFDARQGRRLFGLVAGGGTLAAVAAGAALKGAAHHVPAEDLLLAVAACTAACTCLVVALERRVGTLAPATPRGPSPAERAAAPTLADVLRHPLARGATVVAVLVSLVGNVVDYQLDLTLQRAFAGDPRGLSAFLGTLFTAVGVVTLVVQLTLGTWSLSRLGAVGTLAVLPVAVGAGSVAILATHGALLAVTMTRGSDMVLRTTIHQAATNLVYLPVPSALRAVARTYTEGLFKPAVLAALALLFFALQGVPATVLGLGTLSLVAAWIVVVRRMRPAYLDALADHLVRRRLDLDLPNETLLGPRAEGPLREALSSDDASSVVHALQLVGRVPGVDWTDAVLRLTSHPEPVVRAEALRLLPEYARAPRAAVASTLTARPPDPDAGVQAATLEALVRLAPDEAMRQARVQLGSADPAVRALAAAVLTGTAPAEAAPVLQELLGSPDARARQAAAQALGAAAAHPGRGALLARLVEDPTPEVRAAALRAAARAGVTEVVPGALRALVEPRIRAVARDALVALGPLAVEPAIRTLRDASRPSAERVAVVGLLARLDDPRPGQALLDALERDEAAALRLAVLRGLVAMRRAGRGVLSPRALVAGWIGADLADALARANARRELAGSGPLLADALAARQERAVDRVFLAMKVIHPQDLLLRVRLTLRGGAPGARAAAIEVLDSLLPPALARDLVAVVDTPPGSAAPASDPDTLAARLASLISADDAWLSAVVIDELGQRRLVKARPALVAAKRSTDPLVRETATAALARLGAPAAC